MPCARWSRRTGSDDTPRERITRPDGDDPRRGTIVGVLTLLGYGLLAVAVAAGLFVLAAWLLPAGEQIAPVIRDEPVWELPLDQRLDPDAVSEVKLPVALRGYRFAETDLLLDRLGEELRERDAEIERLRSRLGQSAADVAGELTEVLPVVSVPASDGPEFPDVEPADAEPADAEPSRAESTEAEPAEAETRPADVEPADVEPIDAELADTEPSRTESADAEPAGAEAAPSAKVADEDGHTAPATEGRTEPLAIAAPTVNGAEDDTADDSVSANAIPRRPKPAPVSGRQRPRRG